jgi:hypothetical protein
VPCDVNTSHHGRSPERDGRQEDKDDAQPGRRNSLAAIGFGNSAVDQPVDQRGRSEWCAVPGERTKSPA